VQNLEDRRRLRFWQGWEAVLHPLPWLVLASAAKAHEPNRRTALLGASHLYGEEAKELALAPVRLARHRTKWPCDQLGPPGPPPAHHSCPLGPWGMGGWVG
jgi:hypothetical protein